MKKIVILIMMCILLTSCTEVIKDGCKCSERTSVMGDVQYEHYTRDKRGSCHELSYSRVDNYGSISVVCIDAD